MSLFGYEDTNQGYLPERHFVPADNRLGPDRRASWFQKLKKFEDTIPWKRRLDFYKEDGTKLGKFILAGANSFYFWPEEDRFRNPEQIVSFLRNDFTFGEKYENKVNQNEKIYYSDPDGAYEILDNYTGGRRRRTKTRTRRHKSRRSRRRRSARRRRTRRRFYY